MVCETATNTKDTAAYRSQTAWGDTSQKAPPLPNNLNMHTHTHEKQCSQTALCHMEEVAAVQTELSAFSLQPRVGLHWTHTTSRTLLTNTYRQCNHNWMDRKGEGAKRGTQCGAVSAFSPILTFHLDTLEYKHFIM